MARSVEELLEEGCAFYIAHGLIDNHVNGCNDVSFTLGGSEPISKKIENVVLRSCAKGEDTNDWENGWW